MVTPGVHVIITILFPITNKLLYKQGDMSINEQLKMLEDLNMDFDDYGFSKNDVYSDLPSFFKAEPQVLEMNFYRI